MHITSLPLNPSTSFESPLMSRSSTPAPIASPSAELPCHLARSILVRPQRELVVTLPFPAAQYLLKYWDGRKERKRNCLPSQAGRDGNQGYVTYGYLPGDRKLLAWTINIVPGKGAVHGPSCREWRIGGSRPCGPEQPRPDPIFRDTPGKSYRSR